MFVIEIVHMLQTVQRPEVCSDGAECTVILQPMVLYQADILDFCRQNTNKATALKRKKKTEMSYLW